MPFGPRDTARLTLRALTLDDAADLAERRSDPSTAQYQAWTVPYSLGKAVALIEDVTKHLWATPGEWHQLAIVETATGKVAGDLAFYLADHGHTAEVGYTLHPWARGHGYATEATAAFIDHLVDDLHLHRIEASTHPDNIASNRVLERLGFTREGTKRESYWVGDTVTDDALWGLLARDWPAKRP
ncbi:GNAT family N-acetyltransferase [Demequina sp.]|uniref:GNAT family N-acetyltransferase n=1 Tax=Demequina sp. TaxID=2050685 RepID=UPI003D11C6C8